MKLISLLENSSCRPDCGCIHGLSLYLETPTQRILFDMGPNALFLENAAVLGVDISAVDLAFLSHGHADHGGGLTLFCKRNDHAPILVAPFAFAPHAVASGESYEDIGLSPRVAEKYAARLQTKRGRISESLYIITELPTADYLTSASKRLLEQTPEGYVSDPFLHEQSLLLSCEGRHYLFAGCAHRGIVNILRAAEEILGCAPDYVISGFHLTNPSLGIDEPEALIRAVGAQLAAREHTRYLSGHCTGEGPFAILKELLGERLTGLPAGLSIDI